MMKPERPDNEDFPGDFPGLGQEQSDTGNRHQSPFDYIKGDETDFGLPVLKPLNVTFGRKDALKKDEYEYSLSDPGYPVLIPPSVIYPRKASLKRKPAGYRISIIVAEVLSAAAIIIILLTLFIKGPDTLPYKVAPEIAEASAENAGEKQMAEIPVTEIPVTEIPVTEIPVTEIPFRPGSKAAEQAGQVSGEAVRIIAAESSENFIVPPDPTAYETVNGGRLQAYQAELPASVLTAVIPRINSPALQAFNGEIPPAQENPDMRSNVEIFAARIFHEKIMKNDMAGDTPVTAVDLAEAGVKGINRLIGTGMVFVKNTNEKGELVSVYFSSRALKVNAPVNRDEPSL